MDSRHLAGCGGAPIRDMLGDAFEPEPSDYISTEFAALDSYRAVVINNIPADKQKEMFTPDRIRSLEQFVANGGRLLLTMDAPASLGSLLPVDILGESIPDSQFEATRPVSPNFAFLPEKWRNFDPCRMIRAKQDAQVLSHLISTDGQTIIPYVVTRKFGKGNVLYFNGNFVRLGKVATLYSWAYGRALMAALLQEISGIALQPQKLIHKEAAYPAPRQLAAVSTILRQPIMDLKDEEGAVEISNNTALFANGAKMRADENGVISLFMPYEGRPYAIHACPPQLLLAVTQQKLSSDTSEAVDVDQKSIGNTIWKFNGMTSRGKYAVLNYSSDNGARMQWIFKSGTLTLDGRIYNGIAQKTRILAAPSQISSLSWDCQLDIQAAFCRRMNCYQPPRGYDEPDLSGKVTADTRPCNFFMNSQPFGYICTQNGIFAEILEAPLPTQIRFSIQKGDRTITANSTQIVGRRNAPVEGEFLWQLYSVGKEHGHNEYIALWQFVRCYLRRKAGLKELPIYPSAAYANTATIAEMNRAIEIGGQMKIPLFHLPLCPSSIDSIDSAQNRQIYAKIRSCGMKAYPWTAGDYTCGTGDWIFQNKKDWLMRDEKGGIYAYFQNHRVIDLGNPEFLQWYFRKLQNLFNDGVGYVYLDMGGQASTNVNFAGRESNPGLLNQIPIFRYFHAHNVTCGIEGMNPLVVDNYWYREKLYQPMGGREFAAIGANLGTNEDSAFTLRYFRTAMYGAFPKFFLDGYAQDFERGPGEIDAIRHIAAMIPAITAALDYGMPFIRQTEYGTTWINDKGGAIFVWDNVRNLNVELPQGFKLTGTQLPDQPMRRFQPGDLKEIPSETIFIFGRI